MALRRCATHALTAALTLSWCIALLALPAVAHAAPSRPVQFNRDVRPILSDKCFACHGPDANKRKADLRLDARDSALAERKGVHAIVPGNVADSELIRRITSKDPDYRMPPPASNRTLTAADIATLTRWVEDGAVYQPHWSYIGVQRPPVPAVSDTTWSNHPIDRFVLAELEQRGIEPSAEADRVTLDRRVSFDLVGLPPNPDQVDAFVRDANPAAYEQLVDRLLASPHYGERMAMQWLDLVRFADTNGYNEDQHRNIYPYRDYVIRAFNDNMPFDQFTIEQLAGDLLPTTTLRQRVASGYNRLNTVSTENGSQPKEFIAKYAADRVRTTASVWMGATLGCAECHDHKFDPYSSKDFYSFAAFFADIDSEPVPSLNRIAMPPEIGVPRAENVAVELDALDQQIVQLRAQRRQSRDHEGAAFDAELTRWLSNPAVRAKDVLVAPPFTLEEWSSAGARVSVDNEQLQIKSPFANGGQGIQRTIRTGTGDVEFLLDVGALHFTNRSTNILEKLEWTLSQSKRFGQLTIGVQRTFGPIISLTVQDNELRAVELGMADDIRSLQLRVSWRTATRQWNIAYAINGTTPPTPIPGGPLFNVNASEDSDTWTESLKAITFGLDDPAEAKSAEGEGPGLLEAAIRGEIIRRHDPLADPPADIAALRALPFDQRDSTQNQTLEEHYLSLTPRFAALNQEIDALAVKKRHIEASLPPTLVTVATTPRVTRVLHRGDWLDDKGEIVQPAVPAFLPALPPDAPRNRLSLARWMVSRDNPTTARVLVNRLWKLYFGRGIVRTADDFGAQGTAPTHPELLYWLASELIDSGWDIKHVVRLIVTSRTYRQSSMERPDLRRVDPENQLYARQSAFRLDAEMVRDNALAISGLLSETVGGPSARPYQPDHYWDGTSMIIPGSLGAVWNPSKGKEQYRRGLYTYWKRTFLHPSLLAFDAPTREESIGERTRSNTPLQSLALLNDPTYVEAARVLAERAARQGDTPEAELRWAYRQTLSREPDTRTLRVLRDLYDKHLQEYGAETETARMVTAVGYAPAPTEDPIQLAALTSACRVLLNLSETITRY